MEALQIRPADSLCLKAVIHCVDSAYSKYIARIGDKPGPMKDNYAALIESESVFIGEVEGCLAGILVLKAQGDFLLLDNVAVAPEYQGRGIGKSLINFAEQYAQSQGFCEIRLYTNEQMHENIELYKKIGYQEYETRTENGYRRVYFKKPLTAAY